MQVSRNTRNELFLLACVCALSVVGCRKEGADDPKGTSRQGVQANPQLDARGGENDNELSQGVRAGQVGEGGDGGSIRLSCGVGDVELSSAAIATTPQATFLTGTGIDVAAGERVAVQGSISVAFLRVQAGGEIFLRDNTFFTVLGDVEIAGTIATSREADGQFEGHDLTIEATGIINITGVVDCSGADGIDRFEVGNPRGPGGNGGEIFISSLESPAFSPGPHVFISGHVVSDGGDTHAIGGLRAAPGHGGQILIGAQGTMSINGRISSRGGFSVNQGLTIGNGGRGGEIQLIAVGSTVATPSGIEFGGLDEISVNGGPSTGEGGAGGTILLEAIAGTVDLNGVGVQARGGPMTFFQGGNGGAGGGFRVVADSISLWRSDINVSGGDSPGDLNLDGALTGVLGGTGGAGGIVRFAGTTLVDINGNVTIRADGGDSNQALTAGGIGGEVSVINLDEANPAVVDFDGSASVNGGRDHLFRLGTPGLICQRGAPAASSLALTGANNFPISACGSGQILDLVIHELDCNEATINPSSTSTRLPAITGIDFYRIDVSGGATSLTVAASGETGGNIQLYVGDDAAFGSTSTADYCLSSTNADSTESIVLDLTALPTGCDPIGAFVSVLVTEANTFVEDYTITVDCVFPTPDLDCDPATLDPNTDSSTLAALTGTEVYRVDITGATSATFSTVGEVGGNLQLYVGDDSVYGSTTTTDYCASSTNADSTESITLDLAALPAACDPLGGFVSVLVTEVNNIDEDYTITVNCVIP